jgi:hypothetical protein
MDMKTKFAFLLFLSVLLLQSVSPQNKETDIYSTTDECDIFLKNRSSYKNVNMISLSDTTLEISKMGVKRFIGVNQINKIRFSSGSGFWTGALIGSGVSTLGWLIAGLAIGHGEGLPYALLYGLVSLLPSALVGGLIGLVATPEDYLYDISGGNPNARLKRLKYIMQKHHSIPLM